MNGVNVLRANAAAETTAYRAAVTETLRRILVEHKCTLVDIAEAIGVSLGTISNAFNGKTDLCPTYQVRLGQAFGSHALDPVAALSGARMVPLHTGVHADVLPFLTRAALKIAEARDPAGPGGEREVHTERFAYLPDLHALQRELTALICKIEDEKKAVAA
jgi:transcriptional regulator with XRE-family HTH domain